MIYSFFMLLVGAAILVVPFWKLFQRLGYNPYLSLLMLAPFLNVGLLYFIAFTDFPVERQYPGGD
jgi:hypothetical protein